MLIFKIAFRNIFRQKRRTVLTLLTMFGGFTLASISIAWSDGTYAYIINMFTSNRLGHIQIHRQGYLDRPSLYRTVDDYEKLGDIINGVAGVQNWSPRLFSAGLVSVGDKSSGARIIGINPSLENTATRFDKKITAGESLASSPSHQAVLGDGLARILKADVGDEIVIVSQGADGSIANDLYSIVGLLASGDRISDQSTLYLHLTDAQELFVLEGRVHEIAIVGEELDDVPQLARDITAAINKPELTIKTWHEFAKSFYNAMQADRQGTWIMVFIIVVIVAVGVLNTVLMAVLERTREYGMLRAIGTGQWQVFQLVLYEVAMMTVISLVIGSCLSYVANYALSIHGINLSTPFTYGGIEFNRMYSEVNLQSFYIPAISVSLSAILISVFPALKAARIAPARAMRMH